MRRCDRSDWEGVFARTAMIRMYRTGVTVSEIARRTDYTERHVYRVVRAAQCERRLTIDLTRPARACALAARGLSITGIRKRIGGSYQCVQRWIEKESTR